MCSKRCANPVRSLRLDAEADAVVDAPRRPVGAGVVLREDDLEAVVELVVLDGDLDPRSSSAPPEHRRSPYGGDLQPESLFQT